MFQTQIFQISSITAAVQHCKSKSKLWSVIMILPISNHGRVFLEKRGIGHR